MGNSKSKRNNENILVLQSGKLRNNSSSYSIQKKLPLNVFHRWLPVNIETKYTTLDFTQKFCLNNLSYFNIYNGNDDTIILGKNENNQILLEDINIVVVCRSSSIQAFKITENGPLPILPVTDEVLSNHSIVGLKNGPLLSSQTTTVFGCCNDDEETATTILKYIKANAFRIDKDGNKLSTNVIVIDKFGDTVLGSNSFLSPSENEKVVSLRFYENFCIGKNLLVKKMKEITQGNSINNFFVVSNQCKVYTGMKTKENISPHWIGQISNILDNERKLGLKNRQFNYIMDLGGLFGTLYEKKDGKFVKHPEDIQFMKGDKSPNSFSNSFYNSFSNSLEQFTNEFITRFEELNL